METVTVRGKEFAIEENESSGRTARVSISGSRIRMWFPRSISRREASRLYSDFREWALKRLSTMDLSELDPKPRHIGFSDGQELSVMGSRLVVRIGENSANATCRIKDGELILRLPAGLAPGEREEAIHNLARRALARRHLKELEARASALNAGHFGFKYNGLTLRDQSTRWGSCSRRSGRISLNFRLLFAPEGIMDYVIVHELAHLKEPNHSRRFWGVVSSAMPDYKERKKWLNSYGKGLGVATALREAPSHAAQELPLPASG